MTLYVKLAILGAIVAALALLAGGIRYAINSYQAMAAENATLGLQVTELSTALNEERRNSGVLLLVATSNRAEQRVLAATVEGLKAELRAAAAASPELAGRAARPVPLAVQQRLRKWPTDADGYPVRVPRAGAVPASDGRAGGEQSN